MNIWRQLTFVLVVLIARDAFASGTTPESERVVSIAVRWLAKHQNADGSWDVDCTNACIDGTCTGAGKMHSKTAATALGLLPFLATGESPEGKGPYQKLVSEGLQALIKAQAEDGNLATDGDRQMSAHGLASICVCESYHLTQGWMNQARASAVASIKFTTSRQNADGGWSEKPGGASDLSVFAWQMLAIKSAQIAKLEFDPVVIGRIKKYLQVLAKGEHGGLFADKPGGDVSPTATAIGLLGLEYFGSQDDGPAWKEGREYLMANLPSAEKRDVYYWFFATQAMHCLPSPDWDKWNRAVRRQLIESQSREGCATGSWDPEQFAREPWGGDGGRLTTTSLGALTLEVYYGYLSLYQLDRHASKPSK